ncbi:MAG: FlgD immunoglobulin-like domain containing protein [Bacteroidota bacterium]|nr:FlgD immunoglobulin-like domain containing protein [Bacteroidota bacterium]
MKQFLLLLFFSATILHAQQPTLEVHAAAPTVGVGGECILTVHVRDFPALRTYGIRLSYDTSLLRCLAVEKIGYFQGYSTFYFRKIDSLQGEAGADESILGPGWTMGNGDLFKIRLRALKEGVAGIGVVTAQFFDSALAPIEDVTLTGTSVTIDLSSGVGDMPSIPHQLTCWPLPWNPEASPLQIRLDMAPAADASIRIVDMMGRTVRTIDAGHTPAGTRILSWDGRTDHGRRLPPGLYFAKLMTTHGALTQRILMIDQ